jgi:circadian clock protein KaiB
MKKFGLKLYITGDSSHSQHAIMSVERLCRELLGDDCDLSVVDVLVFPEQARRDDVLATPTLIRYRPGPGRRIVGDLSDVPGVLAALALDS